MIFRVQLPVLCAGHPVESFIFIVASREVSIAKTAQTYKYATPWAQHVLDAIALPLPVFMMTSFAEVTDNASLFGLQESKSFCLSESSS